MRQLESETRSFTGLSGKTYTLGYSYNQAGEVLQVSYIAANSSGAAQPEPASSKPAVSASRAQASRNVSRPTDASESQMSLHFDQRGESGGPRTYYAYGYVKLPTGVGVAGVTVTFEWTRTNNTTGQVTAQTDSTGYYHLEFEPEVELYTVRASKSGYNVTPTARELWTSEEPYDPYTNFTTTPVTRISGTVSHGSGQAMSGVTMRLSRTQNRTVTTNSSGQYAFEYVTWGGNYLVTLSKTGSNFAPLDTNLTNVSTNQTANFTGSLVPVQTTFNKKVNYSYNQTGGLTGIGTDWIGSEATSTTNVVNSIVYRGFGKVKSLNYGNGRKLAQTYSDQRHWLKSQVVTKSDGTDAIINQTYTYYNDGLLAQVTDAVETTAGRGYNYDDFNRLAQVMASNGTTAIGGYSYDKWGNMASASSVSAPIPSYSLGYAKDGSNVPLTNRLQSATVGGSTINYSYDAAGNMTAEGTTSYSYDAANRLKEVVTGGFNTYGYDGDGKRVRKVEGGGQPLFYVWSSVLGQVMLEVNSDNVQRAYVYFGHTVVALLSYDGEFYWSHTDHLGSGKRLTDSSGGVRYRGEFDPYGQTVSEWSSPAAVSKNTHKFTGYERDATGLDNANARMYHPNRGRFMQPDGAGLAAVDTSKPQSFNRYSYVQNDPINNVDPDGKLIAKPECKNIGSISVGDFFLGNNCSILPPHLPIPGPPDPWEPPAPRCNISLVRNGNASGNPSIPAGSSHPIIGFDPNKGKLGGRKGSISDSGAPTDFWYFFFEVRVSVSGGQVGNQWEPHQWVTVIEEEHYADGSTETFSGPRTPDDPDLGIHGPVGSGYGWYDTPGDINIKVSRHNGKEIVSRTIKFNFQFQASNSDVNCSKTDSLSVTFSGNIQGGDPTVTWK